MAENAQGGQGGDGGDGGPPPKRAMRGTPPRALPDCVRDRLASPPKKKPVDLVVMGMQTPPRNEERAVPASPQGAAP